MDGRLSNSVLLRLIIPKVKDKPDGPEKPKALCTVRTVQPVELIALEEKSILKRFDILPKQTETELDVQESAVTDELIEKLNKLKLTSEFNNILKGSKLGLSSYLKPIGGIPRSDLSTELQNFISNTEIYINLPKQSSLAYGHVRYNLITKKINFYSVDDPEMVKIIGEIDVTKFPTSIVVDKILSSHSNNAITNSAVSLQLQLIRDMIPKITAEDETLKIEKN